MDSLVSTDWLAGQLAAPDLTILDCSWHMPVDQRDAAVEFQQAHIPGARFLDLEKVSDTTSDLPHMLPSTSAFAEAMSSLGVRPDEDIILYDNSPYRTAARGWFMLRHFGARHVAILDGGLGKWISEGRPLKQNSPAPLSARFEAQERRSDVVTKQDLLRGVGLPILDARGAVRFEGGYPEPRPGVASGHIPGSRNLPYPSLYKEDGTFKSKDALLDVFRRAGVDPMQPFVATCGSGVTANSLIFAAHLLGNDNAKLYDGSWSEWGADPATPKAVGPA